MKCSPPRPKQIPPPKKIQAQPKQTSTLQDSLISGFGFGIGNSISHNLITRLFSTTKTSQPSQNERNCDNIITELDTCILLNKDCSELYTKLNLHKCQYEQYECKKPKIIFNEQA